MASNVSATRPQVSVQQEIRMQRKGMELTWCDAFAGSLLIVAGNHLVSWM